jgi:collagenase-like PrtC family protease
VNEKCTRDQDWNLVEPQDSSSHYSIFEDEHGTHIFANNDLNLIMELRKLSNWGYNQWKLEGLYTSGENFVEIVKIFVEAKKMLEVGTWNFAKATLLDEKIRSLHPKNRGLDTGFLSLNSEEIQ